MSCKNVCRLCDKLIISTAVTWNGTNVVITIPAGSYNDNCEYCIVIAQAIPSAATINANVVIQIGTGTVLYPVNRCDCTPLNVCGLRSRTRYKMRVETTPTSAIFRLCGKSCCQPNNNLRSVNGTAPVVAVTAREREV